MGIGFSFLTKFAVKTVNFEFVRHSLFFKLALMLPRMDHIKLSMHFSAGLLVHFISFFFQVTYCSSRWFAILGPFPAATIDFSNLFSDLPRKRSPPWFGCVCRMPLWPCTFRLSSRAFRSGQL